ncbi:MAG TPA: M50 family metallopeptidase [Thermoanaerobaculia bacterium]|nr:M50 family metallopeptidase [Thermoanaerobaculia bacterium]
MGRIHLGSILGTTITLDVSFLILIAFFVFSYTEAFGMPGALLWVPVIFISILFHEFAHAAMIGILGHGSSAIVLEGIGGVTINQRQSRPWQDVLISAAGPAASFLLAWLASLLSIHVAYFQHDRFFVAFLPLLQLANILWGEFNLLPIIPLDGSGIVRNFLRMFLREQTAFVISVWLSMIAAALVIVLMLRAKQWFVAMLLGWYLFLSWQRWEFYRQTNRTDV